MSLLIIGGTASEREQKALEISREYKTSKFDTLLVVGETSIGIEQIRNLSHSLSLKPYNSTSKAAIIHPGELLTIEAQNALLKALEEASEETLLILTAPGIDFLLPTVVSRCQIVKLSQKSEISLENNELESMVSNLSFLLQERVGERLKFAAGLGKEREEIKDWLGKQIFLWREVLLEKLGIGLQHDNILRYCRGNLNRLTPEQISEVIRELEKTKSLIEQNINPRLALEVFLIDLPCLTDS